MAGAYPTTQSQPFKWARRFTIRSRCVFRIVLSEAIAAAFLRRTNPYLFHIYAPIPDSNASLTAREACKGETLHFGFWKGGITGVRYRAII